MQPAKDQQANYTLAVVLGLTLTGVVGVRWLEDGSFLLYVRSIPATVQSLPFRLPPWLGLIEVGECEP